MLCLDQPICNLPQAPHSIKARYYHSLDKCSGESISIDKSVANKYLPWQNEKCRMGLISGTNGFDNCHQHSLRMPLVGQGTNLAVVIMVQCF